MEVLTDDVMEKLVELLNEVQETGVNEIPAGFGCTREYIANEEVASHLIANVAPVRHGRWIEYTKVIIPEPYNKWEQAWKCSECGFDDGFVDYNYCPNCGAKMNGD